MKTIVKAVVGHFVALKPECNWGAARIWYLVHLAVYSLHVIVSLTVTIAAIVSIVGNKVFYNHYWLPLSLSNIPFVIMSVISLRMIHRCDRQQEQVWRTLTGRFD